MIASCASPVIDGYIENAPNCPYHWLEVEEQHYLLTAAHVVDGGRLSQRACAALDMFKRIATSHLSREAYYPLPAQRGARLT